jgi:hypothetical protein
MARHPCQITASEFACGGERVIAALRQLLPETAAVRGALLRLKPSRLYCVQRPFLGAGRVRGFGILPNPRIGVCAGRKLHLSAKGGERENSGIHAAAG